MAYSPDPSLVAAIRRYASPDDRALALATALVESGGRLDAEGDNGQSWGPFQEFTGGRGAGLSFQQRMDPVGSTRRFLKELAAFKARGFTGAELAYRTQRPADHAGYLRKIQAALPEAQRILGMAPTDDLVNRPTPKQLGAAPGGIQPMAASSSGERALLALQAIGEIDRGGVQPGTLIALGQAAQLSRLQAAAPPEPAAGHSHPHQPQPPGGGGVYSGPLAAIPAHDVPFGAAPQGGYEWAQNVARKFGLTVTSGYRNPSQQIATGSRAGLRSRHLIHGGAADISGSPEAMRRLADWAIRSGRFAEVFYDPLGYYWDNGRINRGGIGGHSDHVHLSYGRPLAGLL